MPPEERFLPRFAAEPPQELLPYGRWADRLSAEFLAACSALEAEGEDLGESGDVAWYPDRTWHGRTYVPASTITSRGYELFGYVRFVPAGEGAEPTDFYAHADFTDETAERNPDWTLDLCEETIGSWRGHSGAVAAMTLVWGRPLIGGGRLATAELADLAVDQCELIEERFTLIAPDDYRGDLLEIKLFGSRGQELARESLYAGEEDGQEGGANEDDVVADGAE
ncbi:MAG TPA: hypothetical protein VNY27_02905 [Solirubrobacteraceae bacterium]|nr:hypothetical protein [Solirubrobacteraceae bacterium]